MKKTNQWLKNKQCFSCFMEKAAKKGSRRQKSGLLLIGSFFASLIRMTAGFDAANGRALSFGSGFQRLFFIISISP